MRFAYERIFRVGTKTVGSSALSFSYDPDSLLITAGALNITRDPQTGFVTTTTLGGVAESWTYNGFGESLTHSATYNGNVLAEKYTRDDAGRITSKDQTVLGTTWTTSYGYDPAGRLNSVGDGAAEGRAEGARASVVWMN